MEELAYRILVIAGKKVIVCLFSDRKQCLTCLAKTEKGSIDNKPLLF